MRKILIFFVCALVFVCALSINISAVSGVSSALPASTWSSVDPSRIEFRVDQSFPSVSVSSFSNTIVSHSMPWLTMAQYSSAVGNTCANLVTTFDPDYSGGSVQPKVVSVKIPFGFRYQLSGSLYFAAEYPSAYFTDSSGYAVTFSSVSARVLYLDDAGSEKSRVLNKVKGNNTFLSSEYYVHDFVATITGIELQFFYSDSSTVVDNSISAYFNMYLSQIYVEHAKDVDPVLIPPQISIPPDITDIEHNYHEGLGGLFSGADMHKSDVLSILDSLVSDFHTPELEAAIFWWGDLFSHLFTVGAVKTIFYVFAMVSVVSVILGLSLPSLFTDRKSSSESQGESEVVSEIETHKNGKVHRQVVVTRTRSISSNNSKSRRRL